MTTDFFDRALNLIHETQCLLKVILSANAYGWEFRADGINEHGSQFLAAWNELKKAWDPTLERRLAGRRTEPALFRGEVAAGCWLRLANDVGLRVLDILTRQHVGHLGRPLVLNVRATRDSDYGPPRLAFSEEHVPAIQERFRREPVFQWPETPEELHVAMKRDFGLLVVGIRQEQAWVLSQPAEREPAADAPKLPTITTAEADAVARKLAEKSPGFALGTAEEWAAAIERAAGKTCKPTKVKGLPIWIEEMERQGRARARARGKGRPGARHAAKAGGFSSAMDGTQADEKAGTPLDDLIAEEERAEAEKAVLRSGLGTKERAQTLDQLRSGKLLPEQAIRIAEMYPARATQEAVT